MLILLCHRLPTTLLHITSSLPSPSVSPHLPSGWRRLFIAFLYRIVDNQPEVTRVLKPLLCEQYNYDSTVLAFPHLSKLYSLTTCSTYRSPVYHQPTLYALWRSFTQCTFIEPDGDIVFYKNQQGMATRIVNPKVVPFRVRHSPRGSVGSVGSIETVSSLTG